MLRGLALKFRGCLWKSYGFIDRKHAYLAQDITFAKRLTTTLRTVLCSDEAMYDFLKTLFGGDAAFFAGCSNLFGLT